MKLIIGTLALLLASVVSTTAVDVVTAEPAAAQGVYGGTVQPCAGTSGGWYPTYNGSIVCTEQIWYNSSTGFPAYRQYVVDLHGPYSNGSACDYNVNCIRAAIECFADPSEMIRPVWRPSSSGSTMQWGSSTEDAGRTTTHAWFRPFSPYASYEYNTGGTGPWRTFAGNMSGGGPWSVQAPPAEIIPTGGIPYYAASYDNSPAGIDDLDCTFRHKGKIPGGRYFQAAAHFDGNLLAGFNHGGQKNILDMRVWTHCVFC